MALVRASFRPRGPEGPEALEPDQENVRGLIQMAPHVVVALLGDVARRSIVLPDYQRRGVNPKWAPTLRARLKRVGSSSALLTTRAVTGRNVPVSLYPWTRAVFCLCASHASNSS